MNRKRKVHTSCTILFPAGPQGVARAQISGASGSCSALGGAAASAGELRGATRGPGPALQGPRAGDRERRDAVPRAAQGQCHPAEKLCGAALRAAPTPV